MSDLTVAFITIFGTVASVTCVVLYVFNGTRALIREMHETLRDMHETIREMHETQKEIKEMIKIGQQQHFDMIELLKRGFGLQFNPGCSAPSEESKSG